MDEFVKIQAQFAARDFVLKAVINGLSQIVTDGSVGPALKKIVGNSIAAMPIQGTAAQGQETELREFVLSQANEIIDAAINAKRS